MSVAGGKRLVIIPVFILTTIVPRCGYIRDKVEELLHTNEESAVVTEEQTKPEWTVGPAAVHKEASLPPPKPELPGKLPPWVEVPCGTICSAQARKYLFESTPATIGEKEVDCFICAWNALSFHAGTTGEQTAPGIDLLKERLNFLITEVPPDGSGLSTLATAPPVVPKLWN